MFASASRCPVNFEFLKFFIRRSLCRNNVFFCSDKKRGGSGGLLAIGAVTLGTLGVLTYAKNDPEFRLTLEQWIPGTDRTIRVIFQEENKYFDIVREFFENIKQT